jgi:hypothetical protein
VETFLKINEKSDYFPNVIYRDDCIPILQLYLELGAFVNVADAKRGVLDSKNEYYKFTEDIKDLEEFSKQIYSRYKEIQRIQSIASSYPIIQMFYKSIMDKKSGIEIKDRYYRFSMYPKCFIGKLNRMLISFLGSELVGWISMKYSVSREGAVIIGEYMRRAGVFDHVCGEHPFKDTFLFYSMKKIQAFASQSEAYILAVRKHYSSKHKLGSPRTSSKSITSEENSNSSPEYQLYKKSIRE